MKDIKERLIEEIICVLKDDFTRYTKGFEVRQRCREEWELRGENGNMLWE